MLLADAKSAAERAAWEAQRRGVSTYDEQTGICIPGSAICDKNLVIALAVVGFLWLSTCGGVSVIVDLFRGKPAAAAAPAAAAKKEGGADKDKEGNKAAEKESDDDDDDDDDDAAKKKKDDDLGAKKKKAAPPAAAAAAAAKKKEPNAGVAVIVAVMVLGALVWACSSGAGFGGGPSGAVLSEADAKMRARLEAMSQPRGGGGGGAGGAGGAEAAELAANKAYVKARMAEDAEKQKKHAAKAKKPRQPRAKVEYSFTLSMGGGGGGGGAEMQAAIKAYADAHELLGHVFMRGGKVEGRVQGREDRVKATQPWLEALAGVQDVAWEDALTHPFKEFTIMKIGH